MRKFIINTITIGIICAVLASYGLDLTTIGYWVVLLGCGLLITNSSID